MQRLVLMAVILPWQESSHITKRFETAREFLRGRKVWRRFPGSYTGFKKAWVRAGEFLRGRLWQRFQSQLPELAGDRWRWKDFVVLAVDGTRFEAPRTVANEQGLGCAGKPGTTPQVLLTLLEHLATQLPFAANIGPGTDSEQTHLAELIPQLPERTLLVGDAGFFSYSLANTLISAGHAFLLRVGANKTLLLELFGEDAIQFRSDQEVWVWPQEAQREGLPPLRLRLIEIPTPNEDTPNVFLLTNLDESVLSDAEAKVWYELRWGIEVKNRAMKQVGERAKLRSRTPVMVLWEMEWLLWGTFLLGALAVKHQPVPRRRGPRAMWSWSPAKMLDQVRRRMRHADRSGGRWNKRIARDFRRCQIDRGPRRGPKSTRKHPTKKKQQPPNPPKQRRATQSERLKAQRLKDEKHPNQFTA